MPPDRPVYSQPLEKVLEALDVAPDQGLTTAEVEGRRARYGPNRLREAHRRSALSILVDQFESIVIILLAVAAVAAFVFARWPEGFAILAVIVINAGLGFVSEWRAVRSMEALRRTARQRVRVRRQGQEQRVAAEALVPGDIVLHEGGDIVPADLRLIEANNLQVNESTLTGESVPAAKRAEPVAVDAPLADRDDMLYKGTTVVEGSAAAVVVATGMETELGRISELAEEAEEEVTPLEQRLDRLGRRLAWLVIGITVVVAGAGLAAGQPVRLMIETAIALGVAAVPEGLPIVATIALARGMWLMARRQALLHRLTAVETLGATQVIFTDKTGTLTENRMRLRRVVTAAADHDLEEEAQDQGDAPLLHRALEIGVLCTNASLDGSGEDGHGDPTEVALLRAGREFGLERAELLERKEEVREVPFDSDLMMMATVHRGAEGLEVAVKGAPRAVFEACASVADAEGGARPWNESARHEWEGRADALARDGLRVLAVADKSVEAEGEELYEGLRLVGLVGLLDPPRAGVREAIAECRDAGIRVVMVTGDQPETARAIARQTGLEDDADTPVMHGRDIPDPANLSDAQRRQVLQTVVFARVSPEQKLNLVQIYQASGRVVAMTGDGVNDAPALKKADIGVAMGRRGTDAARQVADMVLKDDAFSSIVAAVEQGRIIFDNIRKSVLFMLCTNVAEILAVAGASLAGAPLPLRPLQILYLNMLTDAFPALALGVGAGSPRVMEREPRKRGEAVLTAGHWWAIGGWSVLIAGTVLGGLALSLWRVPADVTGAVTVSFLTLGFAKLWFVFNLRERGTTLRSNDVVTNPWVWAAIVMCAVLLLLAVYLPGLSQLLETRPPGIGGWGTILAMSALPAVAGQLLRFFQAVRAKPDHSA